MLNLLSGGFFRHESFWFSIIMATDTGVPKSHAEHGFPSQDDLEYWSQQLRNLPRLALPLDYPRPPTTRVVHELKSYVLPPSTCRALARLSLYEDEEVSSRFEEPRGMDEQPLSLIHI